MGYTISVLTNLMLRLWARYYEKFLSSCKLSTVSSLGVNYFTWRRFRHQVMIDHFWIGGRPAGQLGVRGLIWWGRIKDFWLDVGGGDPDGAEIGQDAWIHGDITEHYRDHQQHSYSTHAHNLSPRWFVSTLWSPGGGMTVRSRSL